MRAHLPVPQSGRGLLVAVVALVVVLAGAVAGIIVALDSGSSDRRRLILASYPGFHLSFHYPAEWQRENWCWLGTSVFPLTLLTTAQPPLCTQGGTFISPTLFPPPLRLGVDGVAVWWLATDRSRLPALKPNTHIDGKPANVTIRSEPARSRKSALRCAGTGPTRRFLAAMIQGPSSRVRRIEVGAVICGPDFASGAADVRDMLASIRFTS